MAALEEINRRSDNDVIFKVEEVEKETARVTVDLTNATALQAVRACVTGTRLTYTELNGKVVITPRTTLTFTGRITDLRGEPLAGATVIAVTGTRVYSGTSADVNGIYTLNVPAEARILRISFIGYKSREVEIDGRERIDISLEEDIAEMGEVVVTGIFTRKAESYTGAARTFRREELQRVGNTNVFQSLRNLDPSLKILDNNTMGSDPNTMPDMRLRGTSTFPREESDGSLRGNYQSQPNQPLFILDGFETTVETVFDLDMNRIESITILKDAASKAIYGSKAANGVVVIETVGLWREGIRVNYTANLNFEMPDLSSYNLCNAEEKLMVELLAGTIYRNTQEEMAVYYGRLKRVREGLDQ
jgi:TonB-dependent SusC/RagA subfamily outer membrane receptor